MNASANPVEPLLDENEAASILKLSPKTLQAYRLQKKGPPYYKLGSKVRYSRSKLLEWLEGQIVVAV